VKAKDDFLKLHPYAYCIKIGVGYRIFLGGAVSNPMGSYTKPFIKDAPTSALAWKLALKKAKERDNG